MSGFTNMMERIRKLKNGVGVQRLLDEAYKIMGNPIVMFDAKFHLMAYTEASTDDPIWNEIVINGTICMETQRLFETEGFWEGIANAPKSILLKSDRIAYDRIFGKIQNANNAYVSNLMVVACNKPFEKNDAVVFESVCKLISREIGMSKSFQGYEQVHQETVIRNLINGNYDVRLDVAKVGSIYDSLQSRLYVAVADVSRCNPAYTSISGYRDRLIRIEPSYMYVIYDTYIIIIISTNDGALNVGKDMSKLITFFDEHNIYAGISGGFENLFELNKRYEEALESLRYTMECNCSQRVFPYDEGSKRIIKRINALENGLGIQYFLNKGPEIFGNPLLFHDMELNLLAYTEDVEITDPIWEELITYGTSSDETIRLFDTEGFIYTMENTKGGALLVSDKIEYDRISWRIYSIDNIMIGCVSVVNTMKQFTEDELILIGVFGQKFSKEVGKIEFYTHYGRVYSGTVINRLINGKIDDFAFYTEDIGNLYKNLMDNLYLIVVDTAGCASEQVNLTFIRELFNWPGTVNRYAIFNNYIIIIISIDGAPLNERREFRDLDRTFEANNIVAGVSTCFGNIYELPHYYAEALGALKHGLENRERYGERRIFRYGEVAR